MKFSLFFINCLLVLVNLYSIGNAQKKLEIIDEKMTDLSMIEERIKHLCENLDSCFL